MKNGRRLFSKTLNWSTVVQRNQAKLYPQPRHSGIWVQSPLRAPWRCFNNMQHDQFLVHYLIPAQVVALDKFIRKKVHSAYFND